MENYTTRKYKSYKEYLEHQAEKAKVKRYKQKLLAAREERLVWFVEQFKFLKNHGLHKTSEIVCLGARYGEEVQALRSLGLKKAIGYDLISYPPYVEIKDMNVYVQEAPADSLDLVYTNAIDHCYNLEEFIGHLGRISRKYILIHFGFGYREYEVQDINNLDFVVQLFEKTHETIIREKMDKSFWGLDHKLFFSKRQK